MTSPIVFMPQKTQYVSNRFQLMSFFSRFFCNPLQRYSHYVKLNDNNIFLGFTFGAKVQELLDDGSISSKERDDFLIQLELSMCKGPCMHLNAANPRSNFEASWRPHCAAQIQVFVPLCSMAGR